MGRKMAQVCRKTKDGPALNLQYLAATSELSGFIKALQLIGGIISEEEMANLAKLALVETPALNDMPDVFAEFIGGLNLIG